MRKTGIHQKTDKKTLLGTTFLGKHQFWGDFGILGRFLGKALGRILGGKFGGPKKVENTSSERLPRRVTRTPARRDSGRMRVRWA